VTRYDAPYRREPSLQAWAFAAHDARVARVQPARVGTAAGVRPVGPFRRLRARLLERHLPALEGGPLPEVRIRVAAPADRVGLLYLALRAGSEAVPGPLLVAEAGGRLHAAASLSSQATLADDSADARELVSLLRMRADQIRARATTRLGPDNDD